MLATCGLGVATAQGAGGESRSSIVVHSVHSRPHLRAFWTARRIRQAEPMSVLTFSKPGGHVVEAGDASPAAADPSADGTDTGDSTLYPNSANGVVLFFYGPDGVVGDVADHNRGRLGPELLGQLRGLRERAQRVVVETSSNARGASSTPAQATWFSPPGTA
ncbi:MAG: hypothetical protein AABM43_06385 [Actinomycetota bacterium]